MSAPRYGMFADLYELTMAGSFHAAGMPSTVTFDLFVRSLPPQRDFLVACGIDTALDRLADFRFSDGDLAYLLTLGLFTNAFLDRLGELRFTGDIRAVAEGDLVYAGEPIMTVSGPIIEAQLVETLLINTVAFETMVASKAARVTMACGSRSFVDFSARRDHGVDAAVSAARAAFVGGAAGTSLVLAGQRYGLPLSGTMAHSYVMAHDDEIDAFRWYLRSYGSASVLLIDTYDTAEGARRAVAAMDELGVAARGVRLDSGDLASLAKQVRVILDEGGYPGVQILASGDLDEDRVAELVAAGAPIDAFGVGTRLGTSADAPYLGMVYKLAEQDGEPRVKLAPGKKTLPGLKQIWRYPDHDLIALDGEEVPAGGRPLLAPVWRGEGRLRPEVALSEARDRCLNALAERPFQPGVEVRVSSRLAALADAAAAGVLERS
jgi:nicotinate phosphoribosyltransferase